jgi:hypothetical protein
MKNNEAKSKGQRVKSHWAKVLAYFKSQGSRCRMIWPRQIYSHSSGWIDVAFASPKLHRKHGPLTETNRSWPVDVDHIQFTDGEVFADFGRRELMESGVAA